MSPRTIWLTKRNMVLARANKIPTKNNRGLAGKILVNPLLFATNSTIKVTNGDSIAPIPHGLEKVGAR